MASHADALSQRDAIFLLFAKKYHLRPSAIGVLPLGNQQYGVKVTLSRSLQGDLPSELHGIPLFYDVEESPAMLAGESKLKWYQKATHGI